VIALHSRQVSTVTGQVSLRTCLISTVAGSVTPVTRVIASCPELVVLFAGLVSALGGSVTHVADVIPPVHVCVSALSNRTPAQLNIGVSHKFRIRTL
jgi:hypothetical protein